MRTARVPSLALTRSQLSPTSLRCMTAVQDHTPDLSGCRSLHLLPHSSMRTPFHREKLKKLSTAQIIVVPKSSGSHLLQGPETLPLTAACSVGPVQLMLGDRFSSTSMERWSGVSHPQGSSQGEPNRTRTLQADCPNVVHWESLLLYPQTSVDVLYVG